MTTPNTALSFSETDVPTISRASKKHNPFLPAKDRMVVGAKALVATVKLADGVTSKTIKAWLGELGKFADVTVKSELTGISSPTKSGTLEAYKVTFWAIPRIVRGSAED